MDKEKKDKLEELKNQAKLKKHKYELEKNALLQECLVALSFYSIIDNGDEVERIVNLASKKDAEVYSHNDIISLNDDELYYIVWDEASLPIVLSLGKRIQECWDDVMAVAFDTYFVSKKSENVIGVRN